MSSYPSQRLASVKSEYSEDMDMLTQFMDDAAQDKDKESPPPIVKRLEEPIRLTPEQNRVLDMIKDGKNVFFTGSAGSGKSVLLRAIIDHLNVASQRRGWGMHSVAVTASTGIASINIGGCTLHSWAGIGLGFGTVQELVSKMYAAHNKRKAQRKRDAEGRPRYIRESMTQTTLERWRSTRVLIIDESEMRSYCFHL